MAPFIGDRTPNVPGWLNLMHVARVVRRIRHIRRPARRTTRRSTAGEGERDKKRGNGFAPIHYPTTGRGAPTLAAAIGSIRLGSLF
jgi:hypothetical protein